MPSAERLKELLVGRSITSVRRSESGIVGYLVLSDGSELTVWGNDGCGGCDSGWYSLTELNTAPNIITNVEVEERPRDRDDPCRTCGESDCREEGHHNDGHYRIFVFAENERINIASFEGSDGNGYYGTGWWLSVTGYAPRGRSRDARG